MTNPTTGIVSIVDPATGSIEREVELGGAPKVIAHLAGQVWIGDGRDGVVHRLDPDTAEVVASYEVPSFVVGFTASDDAVWATSADRGALVRIDI